VSTLCAAAFAQNTIVSPVAATTAEGSTSNTFPWSVATVRRYQQMHDDIGGAPILINKLSFRINASTVNYLGTATLDLELFMGHSPHYPNWSFIMANNYLGAPTQVMTRQNVTFGPQGQSSLPGPMPFTSNMDLVLNTPFPYDGVNALIWEAVIYGNTLSGSVSPMDADTSSVTNGTSTVTGTGCIATGRTTAMAHAISHADMGGHYLFNVTATNGPSNAALLHSLGLSNPNLPVPGLCSNLLTDLFQVRVIGGTTATGAFTADDPTLSSIVIPNTIGGAVLFSQCHAVDLARPDPIPVSNSNGVTFTVPMPNTTKINRTARIFNNAGGTTATRGIFFNNSTIGHAIVTQFTY
jgi:hypothetical protein